MKLLNKIKFNLKKKSLNLLKPQLLIYYKILVNDNLIKKDFCKSLTFGFLQQLYCNFAQNSSNFQDSTDIDYLNQKNRKIDGSYFDCWAWYPALNANYGITYGTVIGSGTTPAQPKDYVLQSPIGPGTGVGQMIYNHQLGIQGCEVVGNTTNFLLQRIFNNSSGATINVSEIALYAYINSNPVMILHDVFSAVPVNTGSNITIEFEFSITT